MIRPDNYYYLAKISILDAIKHICKGYVRGFYENNNDTLHIKITAPDGFVWDWYVNNMKDRILMGFHSSDIANDCCKAYAKYVLTKYFIR